MTDNADGDEMPRSPADQIMVLRSMADRLIALAELHGHHSMARMYLRDCAARLLEAVAAIEREGAN